MCVCVMKEEEEEAEQRGLSTSLHDLLQIAHANK